VRGCCCCGAGRVNGGAESWWRRGWRCTRKNHVTWTAVDRPRPASSRTGTTFVQSRASLGMDWLNPVRTGLCRTLRQPYTRLLVLDTLASAPRSSTEGGLDRRARCQWGRGSGSSIRTGRLRLSLGHSGTTTQPSKKDSGPQVTKSERPQTYIQ